MAHGEGDWYSPAVSQKLLVQKLWPVETVPLTPADTVRLGCQIL